jgi:hypothetical protein
MALSMDQLRAAIKKDSESGGGNAGSDKWYPFWKMDMGKTATIRILPDSDEENPRGFVIFKDTHKLTVNGKDHYIPCTGFDTCPICAVSQAYYNDDDEDNGKKYWRRRDFIVQALIVKDPTGDADNNAVGEVKLISFNKTMYDIIVEAIESGDLESPPYDFEDGTDFIIKKTDGGKFASYVVGTKFARRERAMDEDEIETAEEDMIELKSLLPKPWPVEKVEALLEAAVTGGTFNEDADDDDEDEDDEPAPKPKKRSKKMPKLDLTDDDAPVSKPKKKKKVVVEEIFDDEDEDDDDEDDDTDVEDLIAAVRNRNKKK